MSNDELAAREDPITAGEPAPAFTLPAIRTNGEQFDFDLAKELEAGKLVLVFYQDDGMPICTSELKAFAQEYATLTGSGVQLAGINTNGLGSHQKFQERDAFPFPLISDFHGEAVKAYGFWDPDEGKSGRAVVIIAGDGTVQHVVPHFNPGNIAAFEEIFQALGLV